jgi:integrase
MSMGRKRTKDHGLPPHMSRKGDAYYYVTSGKPRKWIALGKDLALAKKKWAEFECTVAPTGPTFGEVAKVYKAKCIPLKAPRTQKENEGELKQLLTVFEAVPLDQIKPAHLRQYLDMREAKVRANREIALFSHLFNWARERGYTDAPNPAYGVSRNVERAREVYVEDEAFAAVYAKAPQELRDAMDLAYYTGQRVSDVLKWTRGNVRDGALHVTQGKTRKKQRIAINGPLASVVERLKAPREGVTSLYLVQVDGAPLTYKMLHERFLKACADAGQDYQFRDLRAKAATDSPGKEKAQELLGHQSITMTEDYVRQRRGEMVAPVAGIVENVLQNDVEAAKKRALNAQQKTPATD